MARIISDTYVKGNKKIWGDDPKSDFNKKILAVNDMYGWLYENGILEKASFIFKDYKDAVHFAVNAEALAPYRPEMEAAKTKNSALAVRHIFDESYTPCQYSGAIELGWTMHSYRSVDGMVGLSWECSLVKNLNTEDIYDIAKVKDEQGVTAAIKALYDHFDWKPTLSDKKRKESLSDKIHSAASSVKTIFHKNKSTDLEH